MYYFFVFLMVNFKLYPMYIALYIILSIVVVVLILGLIAPKHYEVNRSIIINKPLAEVFNYLKYVKEF